MMGFFKLSAQKQLEHLEAEYIILLQLKCIRDANAQEPFVNQAHLKQHIFNLFHSLAWLNFYRHLETDKNCLPSEIVPTGPLERKKMNYDLVDNNTADNLIDEWLKQFSDYKAAVGNAAGSQAIDKILKLYEGEGEGKDKKTGWLDQASDLYAEHSETRQKRLANCAIIALFTVVVVLAVLSPFPLPIVLAVTAVAMAIITKGALYLQENCTKKLHKQKEDCSKQFISMLPRENIDELVPDPPEATTTTNCGERPPESSSIAVQYTSLVSYRNDAFNKRFPTSPEQENEQPGNSPRPS